MSDYKIINGKKVRVCKYGCDSELVWSDEITGFIETKGGLPHTKERCEHVKNTNSAPNGNGNDLSVEVLLKELESIGVKIDLSKLRNTVNGDNKK